ncbi:MAG TPA: acetyl-CoA carboxylase biotin carboxyl carrier protein subunit [Myxococcales bacterium]|nr:acetyl-CoA carboxylase biotin carboxyl carrier protein subunit [Myxococcales bacterium]
MKYTAVFAGEERVVEVTPREGGYRVTLGDRVLEVDAVPLQGAAVSLIVGTRSYRCDIEPRKDGQLHVRVNQSVVPLEMLDERKLRLRRASGKFTLEGPQRIDAPMPGKVVRVLVKLGDEVQEGQGLLVVEAMKMENELKSPKAGKVTELHAVEGAAVESGAKLAVVS